MQKKTREPIEQTLEVLQICESLVTLDAFAKGTCEVVSDTHGNLRAVRILVVVYSSEMVSQAPLNVDLLRKRMLDPALKHLLENPEAIPQDVWELKLKDDAVRRF